ncbi:MAG: biotin/lipoyl-containing protein [Myxococcota bacterium]
MKYRVTIDGEERDVDVQITEGGSVTVSLDGSPVDVDVTRVPGGVSMRLDGKVWDVHVGGPSDKMTVAANVHRTTARVESERQRARKARGAGAAAAKELRAPMPGRIVEVFVEAGQAIEAGAPLIVIEAMKMQNELRAETAGTVAGVEVAAGQNVEGNALLLRFQ